MGKGGGVSAKVPEVQENPPIAPASPPVSESSAQVAQAARSEKEKLRKAFGSSKTVLAGGQGLGGAGGSETTKRTLG
jgi:hypothetical protein